MFFFLFSFNIHQTISDEQTGEEKFYALKKFNNRNFSEGMNFTALREITILKEIDHANIVKVNNYNPINAKKTNTNK